MDVELTVKVYGTLEKHIPGYDPQTGCSVQMMYPSTVADLIARLGISPKRIGIVSINGRLAKQEDILPDRALVKVFHPIFGG